MRTRIMSGAVLIVILFTCLYFGGWVTFGFSLFISLVGMYELIKVKKLEKTGLAVVGYIAAITYYFILLLNDPAYILLLLVASCILMMSVYVFTFPKYKTEDVMWVFFSIVYVAVTLSYIYQVRMLQDGIYIVWLIFVSSWGNDTCAYFTGVFLGKHKMTPKLSPKKTELHVEAGAEFDQRRDAAVDGAGAFGGLEHAGDDLEHGGLARAVRAQDTEHVALADGERHAIERAELLEHKLALREGDGVFLQAVELLRCHVEDHGHVVHVDHDRPVVDCGGELALDVAEWGGVDVLGHRFRLNVEDELLLGRLEHGEADGEGDRGHAEADEVLGEAGHRVVHRDVAEIAHIVVHRVECLGRLHPVGQKAHWVEQRRGVGPRGDDDAPQVAHVAEEHGERGEQHAEPRAEEQHEHEQDGHREQVYRRRDAEEEHDNDDRDERDGEVHEREEHLLQREDHL